MRLEYNTGSGEASAAPGIAIQINRFQRNAGRIEDNRRELTLPGITEGRKAALHRDIAALMTENATLKAEINRAREAGSL